MSPLIKNGLNVYLFRETDSLLDDHLIFPGIAFVVKETYKLSVYHEEQEQQAELATCVSMFNVGEKLMIETGDNKAFYVMNDRLHY